MGQVMQIHLHYDLTRVANAFGNIANLGENNDSLYDDIIAIGY